MSLASMLHCSSDRDPAALGERAPISSCGCRAVVIHIPDGYDYEVILRPRLQAPGHHPAGAAWVNEPDADLRGPGSSGPAAAEAGDPPMRGSASGASAAGQAGLSGDGTGAEAPATPTTRLAPPLNGAGRHISRCWHEQTFCDDQPGVQGGDLPTLSPFPRADGCSAQSSKLKDVEVERSTASGSSPGRTVSFEGDASGGGCDLPGGVEEEGSDEGEAGFLPVGGLLAALVDEGKATIPVFGHSGDDLDVTQTEYPAVAITAKGSIVLSHLLSLACRLTKKELGLKVATPTIRVANADGEFRKIPFQGAGPQLHDLLQGLQDDDMLLISCRVLE